MMPEQAAVHFGGSSASAIWFLLVEHANRLSWRSSAIESVMNRTIVRRSLWLVENQCPLGRMIL
jgi:hypothetical protein